MNKDKCLQWDHSLKACLYARIDAFLVWHREVGCKSHGNVHDTWLIERHDEDIFLWKYRRRSNSTRVSFSTMTKCIKNLFQFVVISILHHKNRIKFNKQGCPCLNRNITHLARRKHWLECNSTKNSGIHRKKHSSKGHAPKRKTDWLILET